MQQRGIYGSNRPEPAPETNSMPGDNTGPPIISQNTRRSTAIISENTTEGKNTIISENNISENIIKCINI